MSASETPLESASGNSDPAQVPSHGWGRYGDACAELLGPLSPELALVSSDLAEIARAFLPDRPWEQFLPAPAPFERVARGAYEAISPAPDEHTALPVEIAASSPSSTSPPTLRRRRRPSIGVLAWGVFGVIVFISCLPIVLDGPSLGASSPPTGTTPTDLAHPSPGQNGDGGRSKPGDRVRGSTSPKGSTSTPLASAPADPSRSVTTAQSQRPFSGAYLVGPLRLLLGESKFSLSVTATGLCGATTKIVGIPVSQDGRFSAERKTGEAIIVVGGRFQPPDHATLTVRIRRASCDTGARTFSGRIS